MNEEEKKVVGDYKSKLDLYKYEKKLAQVESTQMKKYMKWK